MVGSSSPYSLWLTFAELLIPDCTLSYPYPNAPTLNSCEGLWSVLNSAPRLLAAE
jgi:hypothetical protein